MNYSGKIQEFRAQQVKAQTEKDLLLKQLKDDYDLNSVEEAEKKIQELRLEYRTLATEKDNLEDKLKDLLNKIEQGAENNV